MLFNSFNFLYFLILTLGLYYWPKLRGYQVQVLVAASFFFYAYENPALLALLIACIALNAWLSHRMSWTGDLNKARWLAIYGVFFNVGLLAAFKYSPLALQLVPRAGEGTLGWLLALPLPIGISFYTFENISLLVDVLRHRRNGHAPFVPKNGLTHLLHSSLFVAFFPHLVSGPILKADTFIPKSERLGCGGIFPGRRRSRRWCWVSFLKPSWRTT